MFGCNTHLLKHIKQAILAWSFRQNIILGCYPVFAAISARGEFIVRCFFYDVLVGNKLTAASGLQLPVTSVGLRLAVTSPSLHQHTTADQAEAGAAD